MRKDLLESIAIITVGTVCHHYFTGYGGTALAMMTKLQRIRIGLVTSINPGLLTKIGVERWDHNQVCEHVANVS